MADQGFAEGDAAIPGHTPRLLLHLHRRVDVPQPAGSGDCP